MARPLPPFPTVPKTIHSGMRSLLSYSFFSSLLGMGAGIASGPGIGFGATPGGGAGAAAQLSHSQSFFFLKQLNHFRFGFSQLSQLVHAGAGGGGGGGAGLAQVWHGCSQQSERFLHQSRIR